MGRCISIIKRLVATAILTFMVAGWVVAQPGQWDNPFPGESDIMPTSDSLTFEMALSKAARANRSLKALELEKAGSAGFIHQAGLRPNPGLELEAEEFSGGLPGFSQSEWSLSLGQEFELWGKRKARMQEAEVASRAIYLESGIAAFDVYADVSRKFFELNHAQTEYVLLSEAKALAGEMVEAAGSRVQKGAAHISELNMAELELARAEINLEEAGVDLANARQALVALWDGTAEGVEAVKSPEGEITIPDFEILKKLVGDSREIARLKIEQDGIAAGINTAVSEARPSPTLRAGIKRLEAENINTFLIGISLPLPFFNRNQGQQRIMRAQSAAVESELQQRRTEAEAELHTLYERLRRLEATAAALHKELIPRAETAFQSLKDAYEKGKLPYLILLEGERTLLELRHEENDTLLEIHNQIIAIEELLGIRLMSPAENIL